MRQYVHHGMVDYAGLKGTREAVDRYVASLASVTPDALPSNNAMLAFWINAYNAVVIQSVLERYPVKSVKEIKGFFDGIRHQVGSASLTLNEIEGRGRTLGDWRIHMAVVCAAQSCPPLRSEAYVADRLDEQLADQARQFLANHRNGLRLDGNILWVSKIFKWYEQDFQAAMPERVPRRTVAANLLALLAASVDGQTAQILGDHPDRPLTLKFFDYNWALNDQQPPAGT